MKPKPLYKNPKFLGGILLIVTLMCVIIIETFEKQDTINDVKNITVPDTPMNSIKRIDSIKVKAHANDAIEDSVIPVLEESELK